MKKALASIGISSSLVTTIINLIPDTTSAAGTDTHIGLKFLLFIVLGVLVFGISWSIKNINKLFGGVVFGAILGILLGIISVSIDSALSQLSTTSGGQGYYNFILSFKWILPIFAYTYFGVDPWRTNSFF